MPWQHIAGWGGLVMAGLAQRVAEPFETFVETVSGGGAGGLDVLSHKLATLFGPITPRKIRVDG